MTPADRTMRREIHRDTTTLMDEEPLLSSARPPWQRSLKTQMGLLSRLTQELPEFGAGDPLGFGADVGTTIAAASTLASPANNSTPNKSGRRRQRPGTAPSAVSAISAAISPSTVRHREACR